LNAKQREDLKRAAEAQLYEQFNADDRKALQAFAATPVHAKLGRLRTEFSALLASTRTDLALEADLSKAIEDTVTTYMAEHGAQ
jgi:hypothetical protein